MKSPKVKPLALAIIALTQSVAVLAQDDASVEEEVYVSGVRAAEKNAREAEREKDAFSSIISQDDAGNFADQNVAESLQRLPGITLLKNEGEGRFVTLRGLGPTFVSVNMNGSELATAGEDTRAFALDAIPSDMLGSIEVFKTLTPDQDLNSLAGTVNVKTISAFDRKRDTMKIKLQNNQQDYSEENSPKIAFSGTNKFADDTIGVGYSLSWEKRNSVVFINEHHASIAPRFIDVNDQVAIVPFRYESKQEDAERTRSAGSVTLEYRPVDEHQFKLDYSRTEFEDIDIALREYHRWGQSSSSLSMPDDDEFVFYNQEQNVYGMYGTDIQHQFFIQEGKSITNAFSFSGFHDLDNGIELEYKFAQSSSEWDKPGGRRTQFRIRELPMLGSHGSSYYSSRIVSPEILSALSGGDYVAPGAYYSEYEEGERLQGGMVYDNLFIEDSFRKDDVSQFDFDLKKYSDSERINYFKTGITLKQRERDRNKDRWSVDPSTYSVLGCPESIDPELCADWTSGSVATLNEFDTFTPSHPDIQYDFETYESAERIIEVTAPLAYFSDQFLNDIDSTKDDYALSEDASSIYGMAELVPFENATLIIGAKYERTSFESEGNFSLRNDRDDIVEDGISGDIVAPLAPARNSYSDILPSVHLKWEARDDLLIRSAIWTSFTRPGFDQARTHANVTSRAEYCTIVEIEVDSDAVPAGTCGERGDFGQYAQSDERFYSSFVLSNDLGLNVGNPNLKAMTAINLDSSISWYASDDLYFQAALFYKDIDDFIADVRGADMALEDLPVDLPLEQISQVLPLVPGTTYTNINFAVNGEYAKVYGLELTLAKNFENGLFISGNATVQKSEAKLDDSLRKDKIELPFQANSIGNVTFGWENDDISVRVSSNYRSKVLEQVGACPAGANDMYTCRDWNDVYHDNTVGLDFKASWDVTSRLNVYFDALNLTEDFSVKYLRGNQASNGKILYQSEDFGSSIQFGLNFKLM